MPGRKKELNFEEAMNRLKEISEQMENNDIGLEESMQLFKEGMELSKYCNQKLDEAERKIHVLTKGIDDKVGEENFIPEEE